MARKAAQKQVEKDVDVEALSDEQVEAMMSEMADEANASGGEDEQEATTEDSSGDETKDDSEQENDAAPDGDAKSDEKPEGEVKAETVDSNDVEKTKEPEKQDTVSHQRYHHERERRKESDAKNAVLTDRMQRMQRMLDANEQKQVEQDKPVAPVVPDDNNPVGQISYLIEENKQQKAQAAAQERVFQENNAQRQALAEVFQRADADLTKGGEEAASAFNMLKKGYLSEFRAMGLTEQQSLQQYSNLEADHMVFAENQGIPIVDYVKNLATARGWQPGSKPATNGDATSKKANDAQLGITKEKSKSLGSGGGSSANTGTMTPEQVMDMSNDEFDAYVEKKGNFRRLMQG